MLKVEQKKEIERAAVVSLILIVIIGLVIAWFVFVIAKQSATKEASHIVPASTPKLPSGWSYYLSKLEGFSIWYPSDDGPDESNAALAAIEPAASHQAFEVSFQPINGTSDQAVAAPLEVRVSQQTLDQATKGRLALAAESTPNAAIVSQITYQSSLTLDGHPAMRFDQKDVDKSSAPDRQPDSYTTYVYVSDGNRVYLLQTTSQKQDAFNTQDTQTMLQSFTITK